MEPALHELSSSIKGLVAGLDTMAEEARTRAEEGRKAEQRRNRRSWLTFACAVAISILAGVVAVLDVYAIHASHTNRTILNRIDGVTGPAAQERSAGQIRAILASNAVETDCRSRRQQARLPAPETPPAPPANLHGADLAAYFARYSCQAQTDPSIYPGVAGQPAKGA